jgi:DICT domain-containing protein
MARTADAVVAFADFERLEESAGAPIEVPLEVGDALGNEWAVVVDAPGYCACLLAWEQPRPAGVRVPDRERTFEAMLTFDPRMVRRAAQIGASLARRADEALGDRVEGLLAERPLAMEHPSPGLTSVTNRIVGYLDAAR